MVTVNYQTILWIAKKHKYCLTTEEHDEVLGLLQQEVTAAYKCQNSDLYPEEEPKPSCDDICQKPDDRVVAYTETMKLVEERIAVYEIVK